VTLPRKSSFRCFTCIISLGIVPRKLLLSANTWSMSLPINYMKSVCLNSFHYGIGNYLHRFIISNFEASPISEGISPPILIGLNRVFTENTRRMILLMCHIKYACLNLFHYGIGNYLHRFIILNGPANFMQGEPSMKNKAIITV